MVGRKKKIKCEMVAIRCECGCHTGNFFPGKKMTICTACGTKQILKEKKNKKRKTKKEKQK